MRAALLLAALLLTAPIALVAAPEAEALTGGCDGVVVNGEFTGHCGDYCNGTVHALGQERWHYCTT